MYSENNTRVNSFTDTFIQQICVLLLIILGMKRRIEETISTLVDFQSSGRGKKVNKQLYSSVVIISILWNN